MFLHQQIMQQNFEQQLLQSQIEVQEATYNTLGKELHDNVGQLLSSTKMLLGITQRNLTQIPDTLNTAEETLGKAIHELRTLSKTLSKEWLEQFNFIDNLTAEVNRLNVPNHLDIQFLHKGTVALPANEQIILFRIVQEAIQNAIKHAACKHITISLTNEELITRVMITNDGLPFMNAAENKGVGIMNMKQRTKILGGSIQWSSVPNKTTTVSINLPIKSSLHEKN